MHRYNAIVTQITICRTAHILSPFRRNFALYAILSRDLCEKRHTEGHYHTPELSVCSSIGCRETAKPKGGGLGYLYPPTTGIVVYRAKP